MVGDLVEVNTEEKVIEQVYSRKNRLLRPPVANIDQVVVLTSVRRPPLDLFFLDRLLVSVETSFLDAVICF